MRIIYMGTPEFAAIALSAIVKEHEVVAVVTQPDKPQGQTGKAGTNTSQGEKHRNMRFPSISRRRCARQRW